MAGFQICISVSLICLTVEIKDFDQSFLENEVDFRDIINVFPNILARIYNFKKLRHGFVDKGALNTTTLISSCLWKTLVLFCLQKKRPENAFLTLIVNYRKIIQKKKLCYSKQQWIGYLMIYDGIYWLLVLIKKMVFLSKQLSRFIISLSES